MKKMKKVLALVLAMAMTLGMAMTAFAEETGDNGSGSPQTPVQTTTSTNITGLPSDSDTAEVQVLNVNQHATLTAYHIVEATYEDGKGFVGYAVPTEEVTKDDVATEEPIVVITDPLKPTQEEIQAIAEDAAALAKLEKNETFAIKGTVTDAGKATFSANLTAGYWLVLITGGAKDVYSPMLLGVYYANANGTGNTLEGGILDSNSNWTIGGVDGYAKTGEPTIDKKIVNSDGNDHGNDVAIGGTVSFQIDTMIPSYNDNYESVTVKVTDTLSKGLTLDEDSVAVKIDGAAATVGTHYSLVTATDSTTGETTLTITFSGKNEGLAKDVTITYSAELNENAGYNFDPNTNNATLEYTNDPSGTTSTESDKTYTYTFAIGAELSALSNVPGNGKTEEIVKVDQDGKRIVLDTYSEFNESTMVEVEAKAEFSLYKAEDDWSIGSLVKTEATDDDGTLVFIGLDAGKYILKEAKAPQGFQLDDASEHKVEISANYNENGTLASYTIVIDEQVTNTYKATYVGDTDGLEKIEPDVHTTEIKNTKLSSLPSTGGIGTTIFTIGGCAIMILAAGLFFANRRRSAK